MENGNQTADAAGEQAAMATRLHTLIETQREQTGTDAEPETGTAQKVLPPV